KTSISSTMKRIEEMLHNKENEMKNCTNIFDRMFESHRDRLSLFCNVRVGSDVTVEELTKHYDAILLAYGAHRPRQLDIPGSKSTN
ncbi:hypothetical protein TELCIR_20879, partial [Teladorsagia circumcincta]